jgi:hypothetical protein
LSPIPIVGEGKIIRNSNNQILPATQKSLKREETQSSTAISHPFQHVESFSSVKSEESVGHSLSLNKTYSHDCKVSSRGTMMMLPKLFLAVPRFRVLGRYENDEKLSFSVKYNRKNYKLGITIQEQNSLIQIVLMHRAKDSTMLLAEASGVQVGDVLVGVNGERFGPWAELRDIMDLLTLSGHFVEMQFERYKKQSSWYRTVQHQSSSELFGSSGISAATNNTFDIAPNMKVFLDNCVISAEQIPILESTIQYFQYRVIKWSSALLAERIESWHLDTHEQALYHDEYISSKTDDGIGKLSPSRPLSSRRHSIDSAFLAEIMRQEQVDEDRYLEKYSSVETQNLRPALSLRLLRAEQGKGDFIVYVIWVLDVRSGAEWIVRRRFKEFEVFRETIVAIRKKLYLLEFPQKHMAAVKDKGALIQDRLNVLQKFLRRIAGIITLNSHHPSTIKLQLTLQRFVSVEMHLDMIVLGESNPTLHLIKTVEVFLHNVLHMTFMDRVLQGFVDAYMGNPIDDIHRKWTEAEGAKVAEEQKGFLDRLQNFLFEALFDDCVDIVSNVMRESGAHSIPHKVMELIEQMTSTVLNLNQASQPALIRASSNPVSQESVAWCSGNEEKDFAENGIAKSHSFSRTPNQRVSDLMALSSDEFRSVIRDAIRRQVETEIYLATIGRVDFIMQQIFEQADKRFFDRVCFLSNMPQIYFDIAVEHISPSSWEASVASFKIMTQKTLPCDKINALLDMSRGIFHLYRAEHPDATVALGADDLLPIFIYVMVQSKIPNLVSLLHTLQYLCAEDKRMSEAGYYLATLQASVTHIIEADLQKERPFFSQPNYSSDND